MKGSCNLFSELKSLVFDLDGTLYVNKDLGREIHFCGCRYIGDLKGICITEACDLIKATKKRLSAESDLTAPEPCLYGTGGRPSGVHRRFSEEIRPERFLSRDERVIRLLQSLGSRFELSI